MLFLSHDEARIAMQVAFGDLLGFIGCVSGGVLW
jgi:hypothetical protein